MSTPDNSRLRESRENLANTAFVRYPEDWIGKTIEVWADGEVLLNSGLFSQERKAAGGIPTHTMPIVSGTSHEAIRAFLTTAAGAEFDDMDTRLAVSPYEED